MLTDALPKSHQAEARLARLVNETNTRLIRAHAMVDRVAASLSGVADRSAEGGWRGFNW